MQNTNKFAIGLCICILIFIIFTIAVIAISSTLRNKKEYFPSITNKKIFSTAATTTDNTSSSLPITNYDISYTIPMYDTNNYNLQYHDSAEIVEKNYYKMGEKGTWMEDVSGKPIYVKWSDISSRTTYYPPGAFTYGPSNYVPTYEDAAYIHHYYYTK